jgi:hypothetical protein
MSARLTAEHFREQLLRETLSLALNPGPRFLARGCNCGILLQGVGEPPNQTERSIEAGTDDFSVEASSIAR